MGDARGRPGGWLRKRGYVDDSPLEARSNEAPAQTALDACAAIAMGRGNVSTLPRDGAQDDGAQDDGHGAAEERSDKPAVAIERDGFNVHAGVRIEAGDDLGRERLARYGARPPLSLERLRGLPGGRVSYRLKYVDHGRRGKHRVMTGLEFMAMAVGLRLARVGAPQGAHGTPERLVSCPARPRRALLRSREQDLLREPDRGHRARRGCARRRQRGDR